ncbi:HAD hydrolase-like protein [Nitrosomonadales bacterium]|nr:HAD hydrolase-like protein [Nitrosomonadales bacterium]
MTKLILFDLDGTLCDTANDLIETANQIYIKNNKSIISYEVGREIASDGINAFLNLRFDNNKDDFISLSKEFLDVYNDIFLNNASLFNGISSLLQSLDKEDISWGIVTNKARYFSEKILIHNNLMGKCSVLMCGDDIGFKPKPSPDLLIEACRVLDVNVKDVIYVGDGHRDILAAKSSKIKSVLACYGYLKKTDLIKDWEPDYIINNPIEILELDFFSFDNSLS